MTALVQDCLRQLPEELESQLTVLFCNDRVAEHASQHSSLKGRCKSLGDAFVDTLSGPLLIVGPTVDQVRSSHLLLSPQAHHSNPWPPLCSSSAVINHRCLASLCLSIELLALPRRQALLSRLPCGNDVPLSACDLAWHPASGGVLNHTS